MLHAGARSECRSMSQHNMEGELAMGRGMVRLRGPGLVSPSSFHQTLKS